MSKAPWVRFFPSDWLGGTRGLSAHETGVYVTLVMLMYERGEPLPCDVGRLARTCGTTNASFNKALETLVQAGKIERTESGCIWQNRVGRELSCVTEKRDAARAAAQRRWEEKPEKTSSDDMRTHSGGNENAHAEDMLYVRVPEARSQSPEKDNKQPQQLYVPAAAAASQNEVSEDWADVERRCVEATGWTSTSGFSAIVGLVQSGVDLEQRILPMLRTLSREFKDSGKAAPNSWVYVVKPITDISRKPRIEQQDATMAFVLVDSPAWKRLTTLKKESYLRTMLKPDGSGHEGIWWPQAQVEELAGSAR